MRWSALLLALAALPRASSAAPDKRFVDLVSRSGFIFKGTVKKLGAATPSVPVEKATAVVAVDEVLEAPRGLADRAGQEVTVRLADAKAAREGAQLVFFTWQYLAGKSVGVAE